MHQPTHSGVIVAWNEWVSSSGMGPWLIKSAQDLYCLIVVIGVLAIVCAWLDATLELVWNR